ncbi:D-alanyl-D-alanine endopeptidase [Dickeya dianthicola]|uniref:D-alanyl-D-alanine endopeptidase n=1 Tax=Dickeya dianthicola TaxID=204039 RepID=UPI0003A08F6B|nr:D-alanyl-D-alanine endopeptidase [Dickeya dianthicola]MCI4070554.1 D-alanyl-D-alanine endopeptidase [Dickeya dianthicola]MCI4189934.1 D-alanyl-D-alanine endopeptidase [Dickeya dianthicola]MCI4200511.1 D-alanyl-D-alanine endopeptidase [Dickeya dianthicola]MCI4209131.1 D-alanyl-D-alanine endopeptidase [Dickeya dianthicola]MCI4227518.1 D-alanyl-D-alanine endopeptidase [Dickeya dianthicola]
MNKKFRLSVVSLLLLSAPVWFTPQVAAKTPATQHVAARQEIASGSAMVVDLRNNEVLYSANPDVVVPIASVTKLMTAMVVLDANQPLDEHISVDISQTKEMSGVYSRVRLGSEISRHDMLLLALMSSENRAAASLAHHYRGGYQAFIAAMNAKARALGMTHTRYVEPTGLSTSNVSTARDLTKLLIASKQYPLLSQLSTSHEKTAVFTQPSYSLPFRNTNHLIYRQDWNIQLTKTGFTNQAGHCLVMRTVINGRPVSLVVLDAFGKFTHFADANRLRNWLETGKVSPVPEAALSYKKQKSLASRQSRSADVTAAVDE